MATVGIAVEVAGWIGALLILIAYLLLSMGKLTGQSPAYQWMNVVGASWFVINGWVNGALPSATLNVVWMGIGLFTLLRIAKRRRLST